MRRLLCAVSFLCTLSFSCNPVDDTPQPLMRTASGSNEALYEYLQGLGFSDFDIKDDGDNFIVEEDMVFPKDMLIDPQPAVNGRTKQNYTGHLLELSNQTDIVVQIHQSIVSLTSEIDAAINMWNAVPNSNLHFRRAINASDWSDIDIVVRNADLPTNICGRATFAFNGAAGPLVEIDLNEIAKNSFDQRKRTIAHELGHAVGLRHTNWSGRERQTFTLNGVTYDGTAVPGAEGTDASSLMNAGECGVGATSLSLKDQLAIAILYPSVSINGEFSYNWRTSGNASGRIVAQPGALVRITVSAYGPAGCNIQFTLSGTAFTDGGNTLYASATSLTRTFRMPSSGSVTWSGRFMQSDGYGMGHLSVATD